MRPAGAPSTGAVPTVEVDAVSRWFGDVVALSDVSFALGPGVTALLGPNGAGKSTLLRILVGLAVPSQGRVRVLGREPRADRELFGRIGLVPQQDALFEPLPALDFVRLGAELAGVGRRQAGAAAARALELVDLDPGDPRPVRAYSKGMRQRVKLAQAVVADPEVLVLDEPLNGLDPRQRLRTIELVQRYGAEGRTVVVSSHVLDEVERFGSRVLVVAEGRLVAEGDFRAIRDLMDDRPHRLRVRSDRPAQVAAGLLAGGAAVGAFVTGPDAVVVDTADVAAFRRSVAAVARERDARLYEVVPLDDDLDSVFRYLVQR